jgi:endonuclease V
MLEDPYSVQLLVKLLTNKSIQMTEFIYPYDLNINLANIQIELAKRVLKEDVPKNLEKIAGVDVSFVKNNRAVVAAVLMDLNNLDVLDEATREEELFFPYITGFLGFRESGAMISVLNELEENFDVVMVNGHGILHPRGFGLVSQVGLLLDVPAIGLAKRLIVGKNIDGDKFSTHPVILHKEIAGTYINGYYVSIGHKITLETALNLVNKTRVFKTPEPIRKAHILAKAAYKKIIKK